MLMLKPLAVAVAVEPTPVTSGDDSSSRISAEKLKPPCSNKEATRRNSGSVSTHGAEFAK